MRIAVPKERRDGESRVAVSPETVKKLISLGAELVIEAEAGLGAAIPDAEFEAVGARMLREEGAVLEDADVVLKVRRPVTEADGGFDELALMKPGVVLVGLLNPFANRPQLEDYARRNVTAFAMELMPRITRAQTMDVLSSQSNLAGYRAVIEGAWEFGRAFPMLMTAAGTIAPARCVVLGAGVAGLQAIATAKRLGAIVTAMDVRAVAKEQVESLGAKFIDVEGANDLETEEGYAEEMSEAYRRRQAELLREHLKRQDLVICTGARARPARTGTDHGRHDQGHETGVGHHRSRRRGGR